MGDLTDKAFETDAIVLNETVGVYAGSSTPEVDAPDAPIGSRYFQSGGNWFVRAADTGSGVAADWTLQPKEGPAARVRWENIWAAGTYEKFDMVRDGAWTMIANKQTTDRAAPVTVGDPEFSLPDAPAWVTASESTLRITGVRFTIGDEILFVDAIRIWTENTDADTEYFFQLLDVTDAANERILADGPVDNSAVDWVEVEIGALLLGPGQVIDLRSFQLKQTPASEFTHNWDSDIADDIGVDPGSGNWSRDSFFSVVRISETDSGATDRSADLATLGVGDKIEINETGSTRRVEHYTIVSATDQGAYVEYVVTLDFVDQAIRNNRGCDIRGINTGASSAIDIPSLTNHWLTVPDVDGFNVTDVTTIGASLNDNAFGVDMSFAEFVASPDWDLVAFTGVAPDGGGGLSAITVEDEGVPLATGADTLNFAGAGVTASGTGPTKLITIPGGATPSDQAAVQARKSGTQAFTAAFVDVPLEVTDFENDAAVVEHDNTNNDRITLKEAGPYFVTYRVHPDVVPNGGSSHALLQARVRVNDAGVALPGSLTEVDAGEDSSLVGDSTFSGVLIASFIYDATANDFLTLQIEKTNTSGDNVINAPGAGIAVIRMTGATGPAGPAGADKTYRISKTYAIGGEIKVPVGQTDFLAPFFVSVAAGQTIKLVKVRAQIQSGTSATVDVEINGTGATGFTGISVTTTPTNTDPADVALSDDDEVAIVVTGVSGTPQTMTVTLFLEITQ